MKTNKFEKYTTDQLKQKEKQLKLLSGMLLGMLLFLFAFIGYQSITKGFNSLMIVPIALLPIVIANYGTAKNMKKEVQAREKHN